MVYVTSMPIAPEIIEYYLALLPGVIPSHARARLSLVSVDDASPRSLSEKLLERPRLLATDRGPDPEPVALHLIPYNTTELERDVALASGSRCTAPTHGWRSSGRRPAAAGCSPRRACRIRSGARTCTTSTSIADAVVVDAAQRPTMARSSSSSTRASPVRATRSVDLARPAGARRRATSAARSSQRLREMELERPDTPFDVYLAKFAEGGGIVEERDHRGRAPQPERAAAGHAERRGRAAVDPRPAARRAERAELPGLRVPGRLQVRAGDQRRGGRSSVPGSPARACSAGSRSTSSSVRDAGGGWTPYAIELNLRKGGTTHPFLTLQFLTDGRYDPRTGLFLTPDGDEKHLVATDHLESDSLRALTVEDLFDIVARHGLHFDQSRQVGVVFHMISCLTEHGRVGPHGRRQHACRGGGDVPAGRAHPAGRGAGGTREMPLPA